MLVILIESGGERRFGVDGSGQRVPGGFILITGQDGVHDAWRPNQVAVVQAPMNARMRQSSESHGGHFVRLPCSLEEVLSWLGP